MKIKFALLYTLIFLSYSGVKAQNRIVDLDDRILIDLAKTRTPTQTKALMFLSRNYQVIELGIPVGMLAGGIAANNKELRQNALFVASSTAISMGTTTLLKLIFKRRRPFIRNVKVIPIYEPTRYSFPSGHTSSSVATATALSMAYPKWYVIVPAFAWAGATSYSRMYLGVHHPTDVLAGIGIGVATPLALDFLKKP
ncbi:phosphatase PAP2 family protein [Mucilaginibacter sp. CSA2-8R]|uniref:phosphatase PAP2 family protein n=1 Tax=Mucilaginibacter sp. CSA2-8R TaxID=3141542 RepID=UPI00315DED64